ncbi:endolytic transglycosylase MltG [Schaalia vaccimaxillae]|uniref:endolytic transglycosylase MltG n=1 Tax=Schaalia vaccimaxillae TaxID=183916 RepID=UPI0003B4773A|nr:endolytic transglycosylase MltG [Schaalia vaccimaxillae]
MSTPDNRRPPMRSRREVQQELAAQDRHTAPQPRGRRTHVESSAPETTGMRTRRLARERQLAQRKRMWRRVRTLAIVVIVLALIGGAGWFALSQLRDSAGQSAPVAQDYPGPGSGSVQVTVEQGDSGTDIGQKLVDAGVVKSLEAFIKAFDANKAASSIRPGTFTLKLKMSSSDAIAALLDDANRSDNTVTVNPGQTVAQVVEKIVDVTDFNEDEVTAALTDTSALGLPAEAGGNAEGWLMPGSYEVSSGDTPQDLFAEMIAATVAEFDELGVDAAQRQTVLIKASILEREVNIDEYLPKVARVIENRLQDSEGETRGRLGMDSTVLYGVGKTGGIPTQEDLAADNPYNSYLHAGLPPTPIASPSRAAVEAVVSPDEGAWLYYVTIDLDTGETLFAQTLDEHNKNVEKFNQYCAANEGKC